VAGATGDRWSTLAGRALGLWPSPLVGMLTLATRTVKTRAPRAARSGAPISPRRRTACCENSKGACRRAVSARVGRARGPRPERARQSRAPTGGTSVREPGMAARRDVWALARFLHRKQLPGEKEKNALAGCRLRPLVPKPPPMPSALRSLGKAFFPFSPASGTHGAQKRAKAHSRKSLSTPTSGLLHCLRLSGMFFSARWHRLSSLCRPAVLAHAGGARGPRPERARQCRAPTGGTSMRKPGMRAHRGARKKTPVPLCR